MITSNVIYEPIQERFTETAEQVAVRRAEMAARKTARFKARNHWRPIYGWAVIAIGTGILDANGNHTDSRLQRIFSHAPGDVVTSAGGKSTGAAPARYIVNPNQSLTRI